MRYNKTYHRKADELAKAHGYEFAVYMGHYRTKNGNWLAFIPHENDNLYRIEGLLNYILINEKRAIWHSSMNFDLPFTHYDYLKRGRAILAEIERKSWGGIYSSDEEREYMRDIAHAVNKYTYDTPVPRPDMCLFLQEAERLGRKVELVGKEVNEHRVDGWESYLRLSE